MTAAGRLLSEGLALFNAGRLLEAEAAFSAALNADSRSADAHHLLGLVALRQARPDDAIRSIERAIKLRPREASFRSNLGIALKAAGRREAALEEFGEAIRLQPGNVQAHVNRANTLREAGRLEAAAGAYREALRHAPDAPQILNNLGNVEREMGAPEAAMARYRRALEIAPGYVEAMGNLGSAQIAVGDFVGAVATLEQALALQPGNAAARLSLGGALAQLDRLAEAEAAYREAVELAPNLAEAHCGLGDTLMRRGRIPAAIAAYERALALRPDFPVARSGLVFMRNYVAEGDPLVVTREARAYGAALPTVMSPVHRNLPDAERPIRIGLVSGDFRSHAVAQFLMSVLPRIDQGAYALTAYMSSAHADRSTAVLKQVFSRWRDIGAETDAVAAERIAADGIDVLIDLSGHTMFNRLPLFARKPAPVQASWLGYSGTTGVGGIDYVIGDRFVTPQGRDAHFVEQPWRLPDSYLCYSPPADAPPVGPLPALEKGFVTFGSFNNIAKLSDGAVALWSRILAAVPNSRLLLKAGSLDEVEIADEVRGRFARHGVAEERLELRGRLPGAQAHLASYNDVDIGLDPFPYNGTTTTAEALFMGVPVLTPRGDRFIACVGESMLTSAGLADWVAADPDALVRIAVTRAQRIDELAALRRQLRERLVASPLCDAQRFAGNLEGAWRGMWRTWCASRASGEGL